MLNRFYVWITEDRGVTGLEYGILAGAVAVCVMGAAFATGDSFMDIFGEDGMGGFLADRISESGIDGGSQL